MPKILINNTNLFFDVYGSSLSVNKDAVTQKPTLLVLHGAHGVVDHTLYVKFWSQFSDVAQVVFLDQRGCGRSDKTSSAEWCLKSWGRDIVDFCEALSITKPIVAGVSMGGHVMCEYISQFPEHPSGLIFCNTEAKFDVEVMVDKMSELGGAEIGEICRKNFTKPTPEIVQQYKKHCIPFYAKNAYTAEQINRCIQRPEIFEHYCKYGMKTFNYLDQLCKVSCPTLLMVGAESPLHPPSSAKAMAERIQPDLLTYHEFKGAGAPVYNDAPEEAKQVVLGFLSHLKQKNCFSYLIHWIFHLALLLMKIILFFTLIKTLLSENQDLLSIKPYCMSFYIGIFLNLYRTSRVGFVIIGTPLPHVSAHIG